MSPSRVAALLPSLILAFACGSPSAPSTSISQAALGGTATAASMAGGNKVIGVMSQNLYLGADLTPVILAKTQLQFLQATTAAWTMVKKNNFHLRVDAVAEEIASRRPALVGLQEAYTWRTQAPADGAAKPATTVAYDYVPELLAALQSRGVKYRVAAQVELFDFEAPTLLGIDARMTDHGAILAREDVHTENPAAVVFRNLVQVSVLKQTVFVKRGYVAVDVKYRGESLRFVSTHLESFDPGIRTLQAVELANALAGESRPVILVGDLNSHPGTEGEAVLAGAGFADVWSALHPSQAGLTCCRAEDLTVLGAPFVERIDYVLTRGLLEPRSMEVVGVDAVERIAGLWPSDHGGVFAEVRIADPRFAP
jgi:endonuclease/exonuclease/phosphatase family metal-dependent hydrolase